MSLSYKAVELDVQVKQDSGTQNGVNYGYFEGYASTFGNKDLTRDIVLHGAFSDTLMTKSECPLFWQHKSDWTVGRITEMRQDEKGLFVKGRLNLDTALGKDVYALVKGGDIKAMSIGYRVTDKEWKDGVRLIKQADLVEISLVPNPANEKAEVTMVKCFDALREAEAIGDVERMLRDYGMTEDESKATISRIKELSADRDGQDNVVDDSRDEDTQAKSDSEAEWQAVIDQLTNLKEKING